MNSTCENISCKKKEGKYRDEIFALEDDIRDKDDFAKEIFRQKNIYLEEINILKNDLSDLANKNEQLVENVKQLFKDVTDAHYRERVLTIELEEIKKSNIKLLEIEKETYEVEREFKFVKNKPENGLKETQNFKETEIDELENKLLQYCINNNREDDLREIKAENNQIKQKCKDLIDELQMKEMKIKDLEDHINRNDSKKKLEISLSEELERSLSEELESSLSEELESSFCEEIESSLKESSSEETESSLAKEGSLNEYSREELDISLTESSSEEQESSFNVSLFEAQRSSSKESLNGDLNTSLSEKLQLDTSLIDLSSKDLKQANLYKCKCCEKSFAIAEDLTKHMEDVDDLKTRKRKFLQKKFEILEEKIPQKRIKMSPSKFRSQRKELDESQNYKCSGKHDKKVNCIKRDELRKKKLRNHILKQHTVIGQFFSFMENLGF